MEEWDFGTDTVAGDMTLYAKWDTPSSTTTPSTTTERAIYRLTEEEHIEWTNMRENNFIDLPSKIETSALGVLNRSEIYCYFSIYANLLEYFNIESSDWVNPGRGFDARLVELYETRIAEEERVREENARQTQDPNALPATRMD